MEKTIHHGRNVKRFREFKRVKQEALAMELGEDWTQRRISLLEQKEEIDDVLLEQIAKILSVPVELFKNFDEEAGINVIGNTFHDHSTGNVHYHCTFNPIDKIVELYDELLKVEREKVALLKEWLEVLRLFLYILNKIKATYRFNFFVLCSKKSRFSH
jgi:transcriptional regulator with XRE-family HTH domain